MPHRPRHPRASSVDHQPLGGDALLMASRRRPCRARGRSGPTARARGCSTWAPASGSRARARSWTAGRSRTDTIWAHDLTLTGPGAVAVRQNLHTVLGTESRVQAKPAPMPWPLRPRLGTSRTCWRTGRWQPRLVPVDRRIASATGSCEPGGAGPRAWASRSDPSADLLARADAVQQHGISAAHGRAELLTRGLVSGGKDLQGRLDAATAPTGFQAHRRACLRGGSLRDQPVGLPGSDRCWDHGAYAAAATAAGVQSHQRI